MKQSIPIQHILVTVLLLFMGCVEDTTDIFRPDDITRPATPSGMTATPSNSKIFLAWNAVTDDDLNGYNVYRAAAKDTSYTRIATGLTATAHTDSVGLVTETVYKYVATARDGAGNESFPSNIATSSLSADTHTLTVAINNALWGTTAPAAGPHIYKSGTPVSLTATPASGYRFVNWSGPVAEPDSASTTVTVTGDITVTANFESIPAITRTLTMKVNNALWGSTLPLTGDHTYDDGTSVAISATPASGYRFVNWSGPVAQPDSVSTTVKMTGDITVTANFESIPAITRTLTMKVNNPLWGSTLPLTGDHTYDDGTSVAISAAPANGYRFVNWSGPVADTDATKTTVSMTGDITVTANFEEIPPDTYVLTMDRNEIGGGVTIPSAGTHTYQSGAVVPLTAVPAQGYYFAGWEGPVTDTSSASTTIAMTGHAAVTALFEKVDYTLSIDVYREGWGTTSPDMGSHSYPAFSVVPLVATPANGYRFVRWTGNVTDSDSISTTITIAGNETVTAIFEEIPPDIFTLSIQADPSAGGTTTPAAGFHEYQDGSIVTITATPASGYRFLNWTGDAADPNSATTTVGMTDNMAVTANFARITHTLTIEVLQPGWGSTVPAAGLHTYNEGAIIQLTASPAEGYRFIRWTGNVADPNSVTTSITIGQNETVTAIFEEIPLDKYVLTMAVNSDGWGTVTPASGTHIYDMNSVVNITATPAGGFRFVNWTGDVADADSAATTTTITGHKTVTAVFEQIPPEIFELTMGVDPVGFGTTTPAAGGHNYEDGSIVTIIATPAANKQFVNWTGDAVTDANNASTTITMNSNKSVTANFESIVRTLTLEVDPAGHGTTLPAAGAHNYDQGTVVNITATPGAGYRFVNWTGAAVANATNATTTVTVTGDITLTANFVPEYTLTMTASPVAGGTIDPVTGDHDYAENTLVNITATPAAGYRFVNWTGGAVADANNASTTVTMDGDKAVTANFVKTYTLTLAADPPGDGSTTPAVGTHTYDENTVVNITAAPEAGQRFVNWTGDAVNDANSATTTITLDGDKSVVAHFEAIPASRTLTMVADPVDGGTLAPVAGAHSYDDGTVVNITATPAVGYVFVNWTGAAVADANNASTTVTMNGDKTLTANFIAEYTLTMAASPVAGGTIDPVAGDHDYTDGTVVNLTATPAAGYRFVNWTGGAVADANNASTTVTMDGDKAVTANFVKTYTLTLAADPPGDGTTTPAVGTHTYDENTVVNITAAPEAGQRFVNWTGDAVTDANSAATTITLDGDKSVVAHFEAIPVYSLTMVADPVDGGTLSPVAGAHSYDDGTVVNITATPAVGYVFVNWTGAAVADANNASTTVTMNGDKTLTANFIAEYTLTMAASPVAGGTIDPVAGDHDYAENTVVNITATPAAGYRFENWTGDAVTDANNANTTITMDGDKSVTANFVKTYTLTIAAAPPGDGTTTPAVGTHTYDENTVVNISATPEAGQEFVNWTGGAVTDANNANTTITMDGDKSVTANFQPIP